MESKIKTKNLMKQRKNDRLAIRTQIDAENSTINNELKTINNNCKKILNSVNSYINNLNVNKIRGHRILEKKILNITQCLSLLERTINSNKLHNSDIDQFQIEQTIKQGK